MNDDDTIPPEHADAADRLRRTLGAVALATPTPDRSGALLARLDRAETAPGPAPAGPGDDEDAAGDAGTAVDPVVRDLRARPARGRRVLAVAAALALLALGAVALRATRAGSPDVTATPGPVGTGWYLPPDGWEITSVETDLLDVVAEGACPCRYWAAGRTGSDPAVLDVKESGPATSPTRQGGDPFTVGGRPGTLSVGTSTTLIVESDDRRLVVVAAGVETTALVAVADAWLDRREEGGTVDPGELPLPDGFVRTGLETRPATETENLVVVRAREAASGDVIEYHLVPTGFSRGYLILTVAGLGGDPTRRALTFADGTFRSSLDAGDRSFVALAGGPVDVVAGDDFFGAGIDPVSLDRLEPFVDGLHEVSTAAWRAALAGAGDDVDPDVLDAPTLDSPPLVRP